MGQQDAPYIACQITRPPRPPHRTGKSFPLLHAKRRYYQLDPADLDGDEMRKGEM